MCGGVVRQLYRVASGKSQVMWVSVVYSRCRVVEKALWSDVRNVS